MSDNNATIDRMELVEIPYTYYEQQTIRRIHHYYLSTAISEAFKYVDMIHHISQASAEDIIYIHLNTLGGQLGTGIQIINAMQTSLAHIICSIEAESHSLGTLLFLAADEFVVHDNCLMMFHNYSGVSAGKANEQEANLKATTKMFKVLAKKLYRPFLSKKELHQILKGEDLYFQSEEIRERLQKMIEYRKSLTPNTSA